MLRLPPTAIAGPLLRTQLRTTVLGAALLAAAPAVYAALRGEHNLSFAVSVAAIAGAATLGFAVDDPAEATLAPCPVPRATRRTCRAAFIVIAIGMSWTVVAKAARAADYAVGPLSDRAPETLAAAMVALAFASGASRAGSDSPGLAALVATVLAVAASSGMSLYLIWLPQLGDPSHRGRWWIVAVVGAGGSWWLSRDPSKRRPSPRSVR